MRAYLDLARTPGVMAVTASQLFARLPLGMLSLAILLHIESRTGSYAVAGFVVACVSVGQGVAGPVTARLTGVIGVISTLLTTALVNAAAMLMLAFAAPVPALLCVLGGVVGMTVPPLMPVVRALYPQLVSPDVVPSLFALDTAAQEMIWIVGPVAATLIATGVATWAPLVAASAITATGTVAFLCALGSRRPKVPRAGAGFGRVLAHRAVILAMIASAGLAASFVALEVAVVARFAHEGAMAGVVIALSSVGSLVGGLVLGHRRFGTRGLTGLLTLVAVGTGLTAVVHPLPLQLGAVFAAGMGFAPAMSSVYLAVSVDVAEHATTEAFGWLNTATLSGAAAGTALAGVASEYHGAPGAFAVATGVAALAVLSPLAVWRPTRRATCGQ